MTRRALSNIIAIAGLIIALGYVFVAPRLIGAELKISVEGVRSDEGLVHVLVYDEAGAFAAMSMTNLATWTSEQANTGDQTISVGWLPPGRYAIVLHHDENADQVLDMKNSVPIEGYAYSNNAGRRATPGFDDAAFTHDENSSPEPIRLIYLN